MLQSQSLALRLGLLAAFGSLVALAIAGAVMATLQKAGAERAFDERLAVFVSQLFADYANRQIFDATVHFPNPAFGLPGSGWYWAVSSPQGGEPFFASASLFDPLPTPQATGLEIENGAVQTTIIAFGSQNLRLAQRVYSLDGAQVLVRVTAPTTGLDREINGFRNALLLTLGAMWLALIALSWLQVRIGLRPLQDLQKSVADVRSAKTPKIEGRFPTEVSPLVDELNGLMDTNADIIARARHHVGNLAHALKTPLAVILNASSGKADEQTLDRISQEAKSIDARVRVYLDRAQRAALQLAPGQSTSLKDTVDPLVRTMAKLNLDQDLSFRVDIDPGIRVRFERQDLEEVLGNLLENACRFAQSSVAISCRSIDAYTVELHIDDDGPGLDQQACGAVIQRGQRLDEAKPGSGLGLSIVQEMVQLYSGAFHLGESPQKGLRATLILPSTAPVPPNS